jgi:hypothetical protein
MVLLWGLKIPNLTILWSLFFAHGGKNVENTITYEHFPGAGV